MAKSSKIYLFTLIVILAAAGSGAILIMKNKAGSEKASSAESSLSGGRNIPSPALTAATAELFSHPTLKFSFSYPPEMNIGNATDEESGSETILIQNPQTGAGLQIYISPFDEEAGITPERIRQDLPDQIINNPRQINVGGANALSFESDSAGKSREVWLNYQGHLYQITTYLELSGFLEQVLGTWRFE